MATITTPTLRERPEKPFLLEVPDEENQRGRKRRRSSAHTSSTGSATLRGRGRHRSLSANDPSSDLIKERLSSRSPELKSPGKKYAKKYRELANMVDKKRRSQSPSRSRSLGRESTPKPRRRQRTRSRSRIHGDEKSENEEESALGGISVGTAEVAAEDGGSA